MSRNAVAAVSIRIRIWQLASVACASIVILSVLAAWTAERADEASGWVEHTQTVLGELGSYTEEIIDAESAQRGYLLTHETAYLAPYAEVLADNHRRFKDLNALIVDQTERGTLRRMAAVFHQKLLELGLTIRLSRDGSRTAALKVVREGRGRRYTLEFQRLSRQIADSETAALELRQKTASDQNKTFLEFVVVGGILAILVIVGMTAKTVARVDARLRDLMLGIAALSAGDLGRRVEVGSPDEIGRVAGAFNDMADHLLAANSARKRVEDELRRSNQDLDSFAYSASHDLKGPLRGIRKLTEWITEDVKDTAESETIDNLLLVQSRVNRLELLLDSLLRYARVGRSEREEEDVDIARLTEEITTFVLPRTGFTVTSRGEMPALRTERAPLEQVLRNLIANGLKHHDRDAGSVVVSARDIGDRVEFRVEDDGPGIERQFHERIFEMFATLRPRDEVEGSGMGLAIVKKSVEGNGGTIQVESSPPARGSAFVFTWEKKP
jgi:signal transduction histidine kinase